MFSRILHILLFTSILCSVSESLAQNCLPQGVLFERQSQIDSFPILYPGCTRIEGDVCIGNCETPFLTSDIKDLVPLSQITSIGGSLIISTNDSLLSLTGLHNLTVFEDNVSIQYNDSLQSIEVFEGIEVMKGSFSIHHNPGITALPGFDQLDTIYGSLAIYGMDGITLISGFDHLRYLGGLTISDNYNLLSMADLTQLDYLGRFYIEQNWNLLRLPQFPGIMEVYGDVFIKDNWHLESINGYDNIIRVHGRLILEVGGLELMKDPSYRSIHAFHNLRSIGSDLFVNVYLLDTLDGLTFLDSIGGQIFLRIDDAWHNFPQNNRFQYIGSHIEIQGADSLRNLLLFSELESVNADFRFRFCNSVTSLHGIEHLTQIGGELSLSMRNLQSLEALSNLSFIDGDLVLDDCDRLKDLSGMENLTAINGALFLFGNDSLVSLEGIENIDPQSIESVSNREISILYNKQLTECALRNICEALRLYRKSHSILGNGPGCTTIHDFECVEYGLSGRVYFDNNQNQILDGDEVGLGNIGLHFWPGGEMALTALDGDYLLFADEGDEYVISIDTPQDWFLTTDSSTYTHTFFEGDPENKGNDFGIHPFEDFDDLDVNLTSEPTRCNTSVRFHLHYKNTGTDHIDGKIVMHYGAESMYNGTTQAPDIHDTDNRMLVWYFDSLPAFHSGDIVVIFKMPNESQAGQYVNYTVEGYIDTTGGEELKDEYAFSSLVRCAIDPNDKMVNPPGRDDQHYTLFEDLLTYTVRFENKGNAEAIDITIIDTLDASLDLSTFRVVNSSYPPHVYLSGNILTFYFESIWLAKNGKGFVTYEIRTLEETDELSEINNKADIIFDFNQPIRTNTTLNTMVTEFCQDITVVIDTTICEGDHFMGLTEPDIYTFTAPFGSYCDSNTHIILRLHPQLVIELDTAICEGESYLGYNLPGTYTYDSLNIHTGCYDPVILNLDVIPLGSGQCLTGTADFSTLGIVVYPNPASEYFYILAKEDIQSAKLISMTGDLVKEVSTGISDEVKMNVTHVAPGMYIIEILVKNKAMYGKVLLQ